MAQSKKSAKKVVKKAAKKKVIKKAAAAKKKITKKNREHKDYPLFIRKGYEAKGLKVGEKTEIPAGGFRSKKV